MKNPVTEIREARQLSKSKMAREADIAFETLLAAERGTAGRINGRLLLTLERWGYSGQDLERRYKEWRAEIAGAPSSSGA